jgi:hypothetical protein
MRKVFAAIWDTATLSFELLPRKKAFSIRRWYPA